MASSSGEPSICWHERRLFEARIDKQADDLVAYDAAYAAGLAAERAKAERLAAEVAARDAQHTAELKAEQARTEKAIEAFASLADRLDALAAERAKPWWRRQRPHLLDPKVA